MWIYKEIYEVITQKSYSVDNNNCLRKFRYFQPRRCVVPLRSCSAGNLGRWVEGCGTRPPSSEWTCPWPRKSSSGSRSSRSENLVPSPCTTALSMRRCRRIAAVSPANLPAYPQTSLRFLCPEHWHLFAKGKQRKKNYFMQLFIILSIGAGKYEQSFFSTEHDSRLSNFSLPYFAKQPVEHMLPPLQLYIKRRARIDNWNIDREVYMIHTEQDTTTLLNNWQRDRSHTNSSLKHTFSWNIAHPLQPCALPRHIVLVHHPQQLIQDVDLLCIEWHFHSAFSNVIHWLGYCQTEKWLKIEKIV